MILYQRLATTVRRYLQQGLEVGRGLRLDPRDGIISDDDDGGPIVALNTRIVTDSGDDLTPDFREALINVLTLSGSSVTINAPQGAKLGETYYLLLIHGADGVDISWDGVYRFPRGRAAVSRETGARDLVAIVHAESGTFDCAIGRSMGSAS